MSVSADEISKHKKSYVKVFITLGVMTVVTVLAADIPIPVVASILLGLMIAGFKGTLVSAIFMHLAFDRQKWLYNVLLLTMFFFVILMLLPLLTTLDQMDVSSVN